MLNERPLTYVSEDGEDRPLTPNDFLQTRLMLLDEIQMLEDATLTASQLVAIWKKAQEKTQEFWDAWSRRYLQSLRLECRPYFFPHATLPATPRKGMVVLVGEKLRKLSSWRIGHILQLNISEDGEIRSATLKIGYRRLLTSTGKWDFKCKTITRPRCALYPLELPEIEPVLQAPESDSRPPVTAPELPPSPALDNENNVGQDEEIEIDLLYDF